MAGWSLSGVSADALDNTFLDRHDAIIIGDEVRRGKVRGDSP